MRKNGQRSASLQKGLPAADLKVRFGYFDVIGLIKEETYLLLKKRNHLTQEPFQPPPCAAAAS